MILQITSIKAVILLLMKSRILSLKKEELNLLSRDTGYLILLRNGKDIVRNYWGFHLDNYNGVPGSSEPGLDAGGVLFHSTDPEVIYPIPK